VPRDDWEFVSRITDELFRQFLPTVADEQARLLCAIEEMNAYIDRLVEARCRRGLSGDDLVTELIRAEVDGDRLSYDELRMLVSALLTAGTDTTRNQLAAAIEAFVEHPRQWERLRHQPALVAAAVDEVLRYCPIVLGVYREAVDDAVIAGVTIPAGTFVHVLTSAANRDPRAFEAPARFDIARTGPEPHLAFGGGIHHCLGAHLAKVEMAEALAEMSRRWSRIEADGPTSWKSRAGAISGPRTVPVRVW
jgi:cytochrome P450